MKLLERPWNHAQETELPLRLSDGCKKRDSGSYNKKYDAFCHITRVGKLPYGFIGNHNRSTRLNKECAVSDHAANSGEHEPENDGDGSQHVGQAFVPVDFLAKATLGQTRMSVLLPLKLRLSFLQKRADAFVLVLRREAQRKQIYFPSESLIEIGARSEFDCFLRQA